MSTLSIDLLRELNIEKSKLDVPNVMNPTDTLGAVRNQTPGKDYKDMSTEERRVFHKEKFGPKNNMN